MLIISILRRLRCTLHDQIREKDHNPFSIVTTKGHGEMLSCLEMFLKHASRILSMLTSECCEHYESITLLGNKKMQSVKRKIWSNQWYYLTLSWTMRIAHPKYDPLSLIRALPFLDNVPCEVSTENRYF